MVKAVLIETLWNVNWGRFSIDSGKVGVLIETLWNVNVSACIRESVTMRINRNIVECKCSRQSVKHTDRNCINRNIVECKYMCRCQH